MARMRLPPSWTRVPIFLAAVVSLLLFLQPLPETRAWDPSAGTRDIGGWQSFPPLNLSLENESGNLASWLGQALDLNRTLSPVPYYGSPYVPFDGFNRTMFIDANRTDYADGQGAVLSLYFDRLTHEFIGTRVRFSPARPLGTLGLREYGERVATSLGFSLVNSSYLEYGTSYYKGEDPNGTGAIWALQTVGVWREVKDGFEVNYANYLRMWHDHDLGGIVSLDLVRWFREVPPILYSAGDVVQRASEFANQLHGPRTFQGYDLGLAPNYRNLTWSFLVDLYANPSWGHYETYTVLLDAETLAPQRVDYRLAVSSGDPVFTGLGARLGLLVLVVAALVLAACILAGWFGPFEGSWALALVSALVPLYARLKRESVRDHFLRGRIVEFVSGSPGCTYAQLQQKFRVANGVLTYHLWVLTRTGFLRLVRDGRHTRYHVVGETGPSGALLSEFQYAILRAVHDGEASGASDLVGLLGASKQRVHYNVARLRKMGLLGVSRVRGQRKLSVSPEGVDAIERIGDSGAVSPEVGHTS